MRLLAAFALLARGDAPSHSVPVGDSVTLWSWERPDDLRWLAGRGVRVAMLDRTLLVSGGRLEARLRRQPLLLADDTPLMAVVRIETDGTPLRAGVVSDVADHIAAAYLGARSAPPGGIRTRSHACAPRARSAPCL